jgi:hypothetical protein
VVARSMVRKLGQNGDLKGARTWRLVAEEIGRVVSDPVEAGRMHA